MSFYLRFRGFGSIGPFVVPTASVSLILDIGTAHVNKQPVTGKKLKKAAKAKEFSAIQEVATRYWVSCVKVMTPSKAPPTVSGDPFSKPVHSPDLQDIGGIAGLSAKIKPASMPGFPSLIEKKRYLFRLNTKAPKPRSKSVAGLGTETPLNIPARGGSDSNS